MDLATGTGRGGAAEGDTLTSIESLHGSDHADALVGDAGNNLFFGNPGDDTIWGGAGDDTSWGDGGDDLLYGQDGADFLSGGEGNDIILAGEGDDSLNSEGATAIECLRRGRRGRGVAVAAPGGRDRDGCRRRPAGRRTGPAR